MVNRRRWRFPVDRIARELDCDARAARAPLLDRTAPVVSPSHRGCSSSPSVFGLIGTGLRASTPSETVSEGTEGTDHPDTHFFCRLPHTSVAATGTDQEIIEPTQIAGAVRRALHCSDVPLVEAVTVRDSIAVARFQQCHELRIGHPRHRVVIPVESVAVAGELLLRSPERSLKLPSLRLPVSRGSGWGARCRALPLRGHSSRATAPRAPSPGRNRPRRTRTRAWTGWWPAAPRPAGRPPPRR